MNNLAIKGAVVDVETPFLHHVFYISIAKTIRQVPAGRLRDHILVKMLLLAAGHRLFYPGVIIESAYRYLVWRPIL